MIGAQPFGRISQTLPFAHLCALEPLRESSRYTCSYVHVTVSNTVAGQIDFITQVELRIKLVLILFDACNSQQLAAAAAARTYERST